MSTLRIGRLLVLLAIITTCITDLHAQYARQAKLVANDSAMVPYPNCDCPGIPVAQGSWVALSADGNTAIAYGYGDDNSVGGAAWIFVRSNGIWSQQGPKLIGTGAIGQSLRTVGSVAISADGNTALVGRAGDNSVFGALWVFTRTNGVWSQEGDKLVGTGSIGPYQAQGAAVALSADGNTAVIDGRGDDKNTGASWVFTRTNGIWSQQGEKLVARSPESLLGQGFPAISEDGNTILFGSLRPHADGTGNGFNWAFIRENGVWRQQGMLVVSGTGGPVYQGVSSALSADGNTALVGGFNTVTLDAYAWVFVRKNGIWEQQGETLIVSEPVDIPSNLETHLALSADGNTALLNSSIWTRNKAGVWSYGGALTAPAGSVAMSADASTIVVGNPLDNNGTGSTLIFTEGLVPSRGRAPTVQRPFGK